jgi:hypothetical protein
MYILDSFLVALLMTECSALERDGVADPEW